MATTTTTTSSTTTLEALLGRKLESRFASLHDTFLSMDVDGDGYVSMNDMKRALHTLFAIDVTNDQMNAIYERFAHVNEIHGTHCKHDKGIRYGEFVIHFYNIAHDASRSSADLSSSSTHTIHSKEVDFTGALPTLDVVKPPSDCVPKDLLRALQRKILTRSSNGSGTRETRLFLDMDTDRSGKVTPQEFQSWASRMGLDLTDEQCKLILGNHYHPEGIKLQEFVKLIDGLENNDHHGPMPWEVLDQDEIRKRRLAARDIAGKTTETLHDAFTQISTVPNGDSAYHAIKKFRKALTLSLLSTRELFRQMDKNFSRTLTLNELKNGFRQLELDISDHDLSLILQKYDTENTGSIKFFQFVKLISSDLDE